MKKTLPLFLLLAALTPQTFARQSGSAAGGAQEAAPQWVRYTYPGEEFSVELPAEPFVFHTERPINERRARPETMRYYGAYSEGVIFLITALDRPRDYETTEYLAGRFGGIDSDNFQKREIKVGGFKGWECRATHSPLGPARVFFTRKHAYVIWAAAKDGSHPSKERFLRAFAPSARPEGVRISDHPKPDLPVVPKGRELPLGPGRGGNNSDGAFRAAETARRAVIVFKPEPGFTEAARRKEVVGVVRVRAVLSSGGRVTNVSVIQGLPEGLTEKAVNAARSILFFPAEKDGRAVSQWVTLEYNFNIY